MSYEYLFGQKQLFLSALIRIKNKYCFWFIYDFFGLLRKQWCWIILLYYLICILFYIVLYASRLFYFILSFIHIKCFFCLFVRWSHKETEQLMRRSLRNRQLSAISIFLSLLFLIGLYL